MQRTRWRARQGCPGVALTSVKKTIHILLGASVVSVGYITCRQSYWSNGTLLCVSEQTKNMVSAVSTFEVPDFSNMLTKSRTTTAQSFVRAYDSAIDMFRARLEGIAQ